MNSQRRKILLRGASVICGIWTVVFLAVFFIRNLETTALDVQQRVEGVDLATLAASDRAEVLTELAAQVNRLSFEERTTLRRARALDPLVEQMTDEERLNFLNATLPEGMRQMMRAINEMEPERRQRLVDRALQDLKETDSDDLAAELVDEHVQAIVQVGLESYFEEANTETKMQLAPLIEHLQLRLQRLR